MAFLAAIPWLIPVIGTAVSALGQQKAGQASEAQAEAAARSAEFEAGQYETLAGQEVASAQRGAEEERRQSRLLQSRALALAAASGGGATDPTIVNIISDLAGEGSYRAGLQLYQGEEKARIARMNAAARRYEAESYRTVGAEARRAGTIAAGGTLLGGAAGIYGKYGYPGKTQASPAFPFVGNYNADFT